MTAKRLFDLLVAATLLVVLAPVFLLVALLVRVRLGAPVLFTQWRPGLRAQPFTLYKFRTLTSAAAPDGSPLPDRERMTPFGAGLRSTSLDELPELWNVLRGDMSLVGPRPLLMEYLPLYSDDQARRHTVRPGITGLSQVSGRNALSWDDRFELDVWYVDHHNFWMDLRILLTTIGKIVRREGVNAPGEATMQYFRGSHSSPK